MEVKAVAIVSPKVGYVSIYVVAMTNHPVLFCSIMYIMYMYMHVSK